jgi:hypothetical protein
MKECSEYTSMMPMVRMIWYLATSGIESHSLRVGARVCWCMREAEGSVCRAFRLVQRGDALRSRDFAARLIARDVPGEVDAVGVHHEPNEAKHGDAAVLDLAVAQKALCSACVLL